MSRLTLGQSQAVAKLAEFLYEFLPAKPSPFADASISFPGVASELGIANLWPGQGSKLPQLTTFLGRVLESRPEKFCGLMEAIVATSMRYPKKGTPFREEIDQLNELIIQCGFKVPGLLDPQFLRSLPRCRATPVALNKDERNRLNDELLGLGKLSESQHRGYAFEKFLNKLFSASGLNPRQPFKLVGEQIDGSLELSGHTYLIEARWRNRQANNADLLVLHGKVAGKATWSRGIFISFSGFTADGLEAFQNGRPTNIICISDQDLYVVLSGEMTLAKLIEIKARKAAEEGFCYVPALEFSVQ